MGSYSDFIRQHSGEKARVRRLYWIYGEETVLRNLAVEHIRSMWGASIFNTTRLSAADTSESEIWAHLNQHPLDSDQRRLIIVTEAQRLKNLDRLIEWLKDNQTFRSAMVTAIFVSSAHDWEDSEERDAIVKSSSAGWVRCALPKDDEDRLKRAQEIICTWGNIDFITAGVLARRVNFDLSEARAVMVKASLFPEARVTPQAVEMLAPRRVEDDIIWSIIGKQRRKAIEAVVEGKDTYNVSQILGTLATHVVMLGRLNAVLPNSPTVRDAVSRIGGREQYVRMLWPYARMYPRKEVHRRIQLLHRMDRALQSGAKDGILESLIALW